MRPLLMIIVLGGLATNAYALDCELVEQDTLATRWTGPITVAEGLAYVAASPMDSTASFCVVDVDGPATVLGTWGLGDFEGRPYRIDAMAYDDSSRVAVLGDFPLLGDRQHVITLDVSNPAYPTGEDTLFVWPGGLTSLDFTEGGDVVVGAENGTVKSVYGPGSTVVDGLVNALLVDGPHVFAATVGSSQGPLFYVIDLATFQILGSTAGPLASVRALAMGPDGHVYASGCCNGIATVDVSDPVQPGLLDRPLTSGSGPDLALAGPLAFVANNDFQRRLDVYDVSDPADIQLLSTSLPLGGSGRHVDAAGTTVYLMDWEAGGEGQDGLLIIDASDCLSATATPMAAPTRAAIEATPSVVGGGSTVVRFRSATGRAPGEIRVIDVSGRVRARLRLRSVGETRWSRHWIPADEEGAPLPSGKYWLVAEEAAGSVIVVR